MGTPTMRNEFVSQDQAIEQLRLWPRFNEPSEDWTRRTLVRIGQASRLDTVITSYVTAHHVPEHEKPFMLLLRRVARVAGAQITIMKYIARCGEGVIEKRLARVVIHEGTNQNDDDFQVRLDCENRNVRFMLEGGEDRLGKIGKAP
jgi:hypothetical protein